MSIPPARRRSRVSTRDALVEGLRARGHRSVVPLPGPEQLAEMVNAIARPGDFVVCLGAGNITQWAAALPGRAGRVAGGRRRARRERGAMMAARTCRASPTSLPPLRGRVQADAPLAPITWFRVGGPAEALVRPADAADLAHVPARACRSTCRCR